MAQTEVQSLMAMFSRRPPSLAHLSDEAAARALSKHFGDFVEAAKELGVDRKDLRRLTWSNPAILDAAHERMDLFVITMRGELVSQAMHGSSQVRQCAIDRMYRVAAIPNHPVGKAFASLSLGLLARAPRTRVVEVEKAPEAEAALERESVAELEWERATEFEQELRRELEGESIESARYDADLASETPAPAPAPAPEPAESELPIWPGPYSAPPLIAHLYRPWQEPRREQEGVEIEPPRSFQEAPAWPAGIRRPRRGGWR